jgi:glycogen debranching enzyme
MTHRPRLRRTASVALAACALALSVATPVPAASSTHATRVIAPEQLALPVSREANRAVVFSNKRSAFYYTQTHRNDHPEHAYFRGFNIAGRRVFNDYTLSIDGRPLDPSLATAVTVQPDVLLRRHPGGLVESLRLFDGRDLVQIELQGATGDVRLTLAGDQLTRLETVDGIDFYRSQAPGGAQAADFVAVGQAGHRFYVAVAAAPAAAQDLLAAALRSGPAWQAERRARLQGLISGRHYFSTDDPVLTAALRWLHLTTDALITRQRGDGIYAGLPWFNEYWGRDSFISLPGATLVTGHFEQARAILVSFAQFQDLDPGSRFYGRLPNIVKPGSIDYHTTDGTPRWVIALGEYVRYSGDVRLVRELFPGVRASIEGALRNWTDGSGYLVHADNETWMDARREPDKVSYSPRSTRANDIQALWHEQLRTGAGFARLLGDTETAARWEEVARRVGDGFVRDFVRTDAAVIADHLDAGGVANLQLRPNALFALSLLDDEDLVARVLRRTWETLVYPWGVTTLDPRDPGFHPYHLAPGVYHKDAAYHNGAVWPWLNGIAMQRMLELGQVEPAWQLFQRMNTLVMTRGVVGGLPENLDAYPHPGESQPRLTGTFLQGWSNAEQLRIWYQGFLGLQPDMEHGLVRLAPRLPETLAQVEVTARMGSGWLQLRYDRHDGRRRYRWTLDGVAARLVLDLPDHAITTLELRAGETVQVTALPQGLDVRLLAPDGRARQTLVVPLDVERQARQARLDNALRGATFAQPGVAASHPVMQPTLPTPDPPPAGSVVAPPVETPVSPAGRPK